MTTPDTHARGRTRVRICSRCGNRPESYADVRDWCRVCNTPCTTITVKAAKHRGGKSRRGAKRMR